MTNSNKTFVGRFKLPDTLVILGIILLLMTLLTWLIPPGEFDRIESGSRTLVVPNTYEKVSFSGQSLFDLALSPIKGFIAASQIIAFVLIVGGSFQVIQRTKAIEGGLQQMIRFAEKNPKRKNLIIPLLTVLFSLAGATFGMSEETLVFILITIPLARSLGYDTLVGVAIPFLGAGAGFAGAFANPFTIGIAQAIAELPPFSGIVYRLIIWAIMTSITVIFILRYALKVEKDPSKSLFKTKASQYITEANDRIKLSTSRKLILSMVFVGIIVLIVGVTQLGWYINEISGLFLIMGLIASVIYRLNPNDTAEAFIAGAKEMLTAGMVIAFSRGILILAEDGKIIDTMLYHVSSLIDGLPAALSVQGMFLFQTVLNFFIPSGSGQAALTMPIMTPLSDLLGISRQTAVLAYQLGDGLSNLIIPTSGVTMGVLAISKIPYQTWLKWVLPLIIILTLVGMFLLIPPVLFFSWT